MPLFGHRHCYDECYDPCYDEYDHCRPRYSYCHQPQVVYVQQRPYTTVPTVSYTTSTAYHTPYQYEYPYANNGYSRSTAPPNPPYPGYGYPQAYSVPQSTYPQTAPYGQYPPQPPYGQRPLQPLPAPAAPQLPTGQPMPNYNNPPPVYAAVAPPMKKK